MKLCNHSPLAQLPNKLCTNKVKMYFMKIALGLKKCFCNITLDYISSMQAIVEAIQVSITVPAMNHLLFYSTNQQTNLIRNYTLFISKIVHVTLSVGRSVGPWTVGFSAYEE